MAARGAPIGLANVAYADPACHPSPNTATPSLLCPWKPEAGNPEERQTTCRRLPRLHGQVGNMDQSVLDPWFLGSVPQNGCLMLHQANTEFYHGPGTDILTARHAWLPVVL
jgi:hypothetical protein